MNVELSTTWIYPIYNEWKQKRILRSPSMIFYTNVVTCLFSFSTSLHKTNEIYSWNEEISSYWTLWDARFALLLRATHHHIKLCWMKYVPWNEFGINLSLADVKCPTLYFKLGSDPYFQEYCRSKNIFKNHPQGDDWERQRKSLWLRFSIFVEQKPEIAIEVLINEPPRFPTCIQYLFSPSSRLPYRTLIQDPSKRAEWEREREEIGELILFYVYYCEL